MTGFETCTERFTLTGFIDVDATSGNTGTIIDYDLFTNGREFNLGRLTSQFIAGWIITYLGARAYDKADINIELLLETTSSLFSGLPTIINSAQIGGPW